jgi:putative transposase
MPRQARLDSPGVLHHVMIRGIARRKIFLKVKDRGNLLECLSEFLTQGETACYAWVLIPNQGRGDVHENMEMRTYNRFSDS